MKNSVVLLAAVVLPFFAFGRAAESAQAGPQDLSSTGEPPMLGIRWARGFQPSARQNEAGHHRGGNPDMTYHGGKILPNAVTGSIFWGTSWGSYSGDKITGMDSWYSGFNGSDYAKTCDEYTGSNGQV